MTGPRDTAVPDPIRATYRLGPDDKSSADAIPARNESTRGLCDLSGSELEKLLRDREISAAGLLEAHIARIEEANPRINAFTSFRFDEARAEAEAADREAARRDWHGPLHGLPYAIKDNFDLEGVPTTFGCSLMAGNRARADSLHVARARAAGAIVIGKTSLPEFSFGAQTTNRLVGTTRNPHDPTKSVAGSSGGAAAALAAGMTVLADGNDLGGSLRSPAAWCGVVGFRPSSGAIPYVPNRVPFGEMNTVGPMARSVEDVTLVFDAMRGADPRDPRSRSCEPAGEAGPVIRIAWSMAPCGAKTDPAIVTALERARGWFEDLGCALEEACPDIGEGLAVQRVFRGLSALAEFGPLISGRESEFAPELVRAVAAGRALSGDGIAAARRARGRCWRTVCDFFERFDLLVWPATCGQAFPADLGEDRIEEDWTPVLLTPTLELPAISVPAGRTPDGMPVGLQIIGPRGHDLDVLRVARDLERAMGRPA